MIMTASERLQLTPKKIKTTGSYFFEEIPCRKAYCKCGCKVRDGDWVTGCRNCGRRIRP